MNELAIFKNPEFGQLEVAMIYEKEYFGATECAEMLGYGKGRDAISRHCRYAVKHGVPHPQSPGKEIEKTFIPESDVYRLIVKAADQSRNPEIKEKAARFERWIFDEILPTISRSGTYIQPEAQPQPPSIAPPKTDAYAEAVLLNARTRQAALMVRMANDKRLGQQVVEALMMEAAQVCTGRMIPYQPSMPALPSPPTLPAQSMPKVEQPREKTYTATDIAILAKVSLQKVGYVAKKHGIKTPDNGYEVEITNKYGDHEKVKVFRYNERGKAKLLSWLLG